MTIMQNDIYKIFRYVAVVLLALTASCGDDIDIPEGEGPEDGVLTFTITIPDAEKVVTRAGEDTSDEREIKDLSVLLYDADGNLLQAEKNMDFSQPSGDDNSTTVRVSLNDAARKAALDNVNATLYIIANAQDLLNHETIETVSGLTGITENCALPRSKGFMMSGRYTGPLSSIDLLTKNIILYRTEAKVTVQSEASANFNVEDISLYRGSDMGFLTAGCTDAAEAQRYCASSTDTKAIALSNSNLLYTYPAKNTASDTEDGISVVVGGKYNSCSATTYYRIDLCRKDKTGKLSYLNIDPNHWYEIHIDKVSSQGYASADEAAANPASNISVTIYDHAPEVLNMAFDGTRELGVTDVIDYTGEPNGTKTLTVKYYSKKESDMTTAPVLTTNAKWLSISGPKVKDDGDQSDTPGKIAEYTVTFINDGETGILSEVITTTWQGLSRETKVTWSRPFDGAEICDAKLTIHPTDGTGIKTINNYWDFLKNTVKGIAPDKMGGLVRNQGFHFPVMYGKKGLSNEERWMYSYDLTIKDISTNDYECTWEIAGDEAVRKVNVVQDQNGTNYTLKLTRAGNTYNNDGSGNGANDYAYGTGELILTFTPKVPGSSLPVKRFKLHLYHTGFFHDDQDAGNHIVGTFNKGYYYYEVLPVVGANGRERYMLDRNLGATACGMYIQNAEGNNIMPADVSWPFSPGEDSAGARYRVAEPKNNYSNVTMYDNVTPPGYRVPYQKLWDAMRSNVHFIARAATMGNVSYYTAQYETKVCDYLATGTPDNKSDSRTIYFPKARYVDSRGNKLGDANTGYYWTGTEAFGLEKEQIGNWLRIFQITGQVTNYINGHVDNDAMSTRVVNDIAENTTTTRISFTLKGATNVFMYIGNKSDKMFTTSWPGHAIGNYETADDHNFNFVYESSGYEAKDFNVIFTYIDSSGMIHVVREIKIDGHDANEYIAGTDLKSSTGIKASLLVGHTVSCVKPF